MGPPKDSTTVTHGATWVPGVAGSGPEEGWVSIKISGKAGGPQAVMYADLRICIVCTDTYICTIYTHTHSLTFENTQIHASTVYTI